MIGMIFATLFAAVQFLKQHLMESRQVRCVNVVYLTTAFAYFIMLSITSLSFLTCSKTIETTSCLRYWWFMFDLYYFVYLAIHVCNVVYGYVMLSKTYNCSFVLNMGKS